MSLARYVCVCVDVSLTNELSQKTVCVCMCGQLAPVLVWNPAVVYYNCCISMRERERERDMLYIYKREMERKRERERDAVNL